MAKANFSNAKIILARETTEGEAPTTAADYKALRITSDSLDHGISVIESEEVTPGRLPSGSIRVNVTGTGDINFQFSRRDYDDLIRGAMFSAFSADAVPESQGKNINTDVASIAVTGASGDNFTLDSDVGGTLFDTVVVDQGIRVIGLVQGTVYAKATAVSGDGGRTIACKGFRINPTTGAAATVSNVTATANCKVRADMIRIRTFKSLNAGMSKGNTFTLERQYTDIGSGANVFQLFKGMLVNTWNLNFTVRQIVTGSFNFLGGFPTTNDATVIASGSATAATSNRIANTLDNIKNINEGGFGASLADVFKYTDLSFSLNNNLEDLPAFGVLGPDEIAIGTVGMTGNFAVYLDKAQARTLIQNLENNVVTSLHWRVTLDNDDYLFSMPALDNTSVRSVIAGRRGAVRIEAGFSAKADANSNAFQIDRFLA